MFISTHLYPFTESNWTKKQTKQVGEGRHQQHSSKWGDLSRKAKYNNPRRLTPLTQFYILVM